jgi:hypothetical protein
MRLGNFFSFLSLFLSIHLMQATAFANNADLHDEGFDLKAISAELEKNGIEGYVHGSAQGLGLYVFSYRNPGEFFKHIEFSLFTRATDVKKQLAALNRHDRVRILGKFIENPSAQPHIKVSEVKVVKAFTDAERDKLPKYTHQTDVAAALKGKTEIEAIVHAVAREGKVLVVEYGDAIIPVALTDSTLTEKLYRGDRIRLHFKKQSFPRKPTHIELDETAAKPIEVLEHLVDNHGKAVDPTMEGELIYFPVSPQVSVPVFALRITDANGTFRNYTLLNFNPEVFEKIRDRCMDVWKKHAAGAENGRNYLVNPKLKVRATGELNMVDRSQANPQIILKGPEDLEFTHEGVPVK